MDCSFLGTNPAQLTIADHQAPEGSHIGSQRFQSASDEQRSKGPNSSNTDFIATPDGKSQAMPGQTLRAVRLQDNISCGIIGIAVHGIGTGEGARSGKADIV